jgi:putative FmdB family regulatory protein
MPAYTYRCRDCGCEFTVVQSACEIAESEKRCPKCDSANVGRVEPHRPARPQEVVP